MLEFKKISKTLGTDSSGALKIMSKYRCPNCGKSFGEHVGISCEDGNSWPLASLIASCKNEGHTFNLSKITDLIRGKWS